MSDTENLRNALAWHNYAEQYMLGAVAALIEATDFDVTPAKRHKARNAVKYNLRLAHMALENANMIRAVDE